MYTLSADQVVEKRSSLEARLKFYKYMQPSQHLTCVSTQGMKDYEIINKITGKARPWQLLHMCASDRACQTELLDQAAAYMICSVEGTPLDNDFKKILGKPTSTAQIVSYGMKDIDFNWLTSNQI